MTLFLSLRLFVRGWKKYHAVDPWLPVLSPHVAMAESASLREGRYVWQQSGYSPLLSSAQLSAATHEDQDT